MSAPARERSNRGIAFVNDRDGHPRAILANALTALRQSQVWDGVLAYDTFSLRVVTRRRALWHLEGGQLWTTDDCTLLTEWMQRHGVLVGTTIATEAMLSTAKRQSFHPARDYFEGLQWDRTARLDRWLVHYLGVKESQFALGVGSRWLISAVARVFRPGCQADYALLLQGPQGIKKSLALQTLAGDDWFSDHLSDLGNKDSRIELQGKLIVELGELVAVRGAAVERWKNFLTSRVDHFRPPYERSVSPHPRQCVFAATTNEDTPFTDATGNRRFWPVDCGEIDIVGLKRDRDQLWAEAMSRFKEGAPWWLETDELTQAAVVEQEKRYEPGQWDDVILEWIDDPTQRRDGTIPIEPFDSDENRVTITDVLVHGIGKRLEQIESRDQHSVGRCLRHAGWGKPKQDRTRGKSRGKRFFYRPEGWEPMQTWEP